MFKLALCGSLLIGWTLVWLVCFWHGVAKTRHLRKNKVKWLLAFLFLAPLAYLVWETWSATPLPEKPEEIDTPPNLCILVEKNEDSQVIHTIIARENAVYTIGSGRACDIRLPRAKGVGIVHARLRFYRGAWQIKTPNQLFIDEGRLRVDTWKQLPIGCTIKIAHFVLTPLHCVEKMF